MVKMKFIKTKKLICMIQLRNVALTSLLNSPKAVLVGGGTEAKLNGETSF